MIDLILPPILLPSKEIDCSVDQDAKSSFQRLSRKLDALMNDVHAVWFDVTELLYESFYCQLEKMDKVYEQWVDKFHHANENLHHVEYVTELLQKEVGKWSRQYASHSPVTGEYQEVLNMRMQFLWVTVRSSRERIQTAWLGD
jgi:hypothetical protein